MRKSRLLYAAWMVFLLIFIVLNNTYTGIILLAVSVILPVISVIMVLLSGKTTDVEITMEREAVKNEKVKGYIVFKNRGKIPVFRAAAVIMAENRLTGTTEEISFNLSLLPEKEIKKSFELTSEFCGQIIASISEICIYDIFGLVVLKKECESTGNSLVKPELFPLDYEIFYGESGSLDSDDFSMKKSGFDPSETFAIREYRDGDSPKQIHWKLSCKFDSLYIKEYGLPIQNTILLLFETGTGNEDGKIRPEDIDGAAEAVFSLAEKLTEDLIVYNIGWYDHQLNQFRCNEVGSQDMLITTIAQVIGNRPEKDDMSVTDHFVENYSADKFAHIVIFSTEKCSGTESLKENALVKEIICNSSNSKGMTVEDVVYTTPESLAEDLIYLEI